LETGADDVLSVIRQPHFGSWPNEKGHGHLANAKHGVAFGNHRESFFPSEAGRALLPGGSPILE
jgi:hypothetical protein